MALDQKFRRFALLMESEIARMLERHAAAIQGSDDVRPDQAHGLVTYYQRGAVLFQARFEKIADYAPELGIFKWWFHGFSPQLDKVRLGHAYREGERWQMSELTREQLIVDDEEAETLCRVAAHLSRADGVLRAPAAGHVIWYALYDVRDTGSARPPAHEPLRDTQVTRGSERPAWMVDGHDGGDDNLQHRPGFRPAVVGSSHSVPPPAHRTGPLPPTRPTLGVRSLAPFALSVSDDPSPPIPPAPRVPQGHGLPIREVRREVFLPVAQAALAEVVHHVPDFGQGLLVIRIDLEQGKGRFIVQLVATDGTGDLHSIDASKPLVDAVGKMIGDDARDGNGRWKKLVARLRHTERGAAVEQSVG